MNMWKDIWWAGGETGAPLENPEIQPDFAKLSYFSSLIALVWFYFIIFYCFYGFCDSKAAFVSIFNQFIMILSPSSRGRRSAWRNKTKVFKIPLVHFFYILCPFSSKTFFLFFPHMCTGYGLHCHRAVITLCKLIGIKDMYCKVEGSVNLLNITRALFTGLAQQVR